MQVDWLECTVKGATRLILSALRQFFRTSWQENDRGGMGYDASATVWETGRVFWSSNRAEMGVHVRLPSSALAASGIDPIKVLCDLRNLGAKFTRVDLAADDTEGTLDLQEIARKIENKCEVVCQAHEGDRRSGTFGKGKEGHTEYLGSRQSETYVRIYDKAAEQKAKGKGIIPHWVRVEFEYKRDRAQAAAVHIATHRTDWRNAARGWFLAYLDFKEPSEDENKSRWPSSEWWLKFLENASKVRLFISREAKTVDDVVNWVERQVAPSLFVLADTIGHDALFRMVGEASARLKSKHIEMIESYGQVRGATQPDLA